MIHKLNLDHTGTLCNKDHIQRYFAKFGLAPTECRNIQLFGNGEGVINEQCPECEKAESEIVMLELMYQ